MTPSDFQTSIPHYSPSPSQLWPQPPNPPGGTPEIALGYPSGRRLLFDAKNSPPKHTEASLAAGAAPHASTVPVSAGLGKHLLGERMS